MSAHKPTPGVGSSAAADLDADARSAPQFAETGAVECDETNPECRCPECVNAASDEADKG